MIVHTGNMSKWSTFSRKPTSASSTRKEARDSLRCRLVHISYGDLLRCLSLSLNGRQTDWTIDWYCTWCHAAGEPSNSVPNKIQFRVKTLHYYEENIWNYVELYRKPLEHHWTMWRRKSPLNGRDLPSSEAHDQKLDSACCYMRRLRFPAQPRVLHSLVSSTVIMRKIAIEQSESRNISQY